MGEIGPTWTRGKVQVAREVTPHARASPGLCWLLAQGRTELAVSPAILFTPDAVRLTVLAVPEAVRLTVLAVPAREHGPTGCEREAEPGPEHETGA